MNEFIQLVFTGLTLGFIYALVGLGYTMVYQTKKVINFSQGELVMLGGITSAVVFEQTASIVLALLFALVACIFFAWLLKKFFNLSKNSDSLSLIVLTIGYAFFIRGFVEIFIGKNIFTFPDFLNERNLNIYYAGAVFTFSSLLISLVALLIVLFLHLFLKYHRQGRAILGVCENEQAAKLMGIEIDKIHGLVFVLAAVIGALGGVLLTIFSSIHYESGIILGLKGFVAAVLGGIGSPLGAVLGGILLGTFESFIAGYFSTEYKDAFAFVLLILVLLVKSDGVLGKSY